MVFKSVYEEERKLSKGAGMKEREIKRGRER